MEALFSAQRKTIRALFICLIFGGICNCAKAQFRDNEAREALLKERQRIDALRTDFEKLRGDAQLFRSEAEAVRREAEVLRRDVNGVKTNLDLMFRKVDTNSVDELEILKNAQQDLLNQLEDARKEVRELRGKIEMMQAGGTNSSVRPDVLQQLMEQQRNFEERLNSLAITRK